MVLEISRTDFSFYTHEELRQLCQVEINNSQTFSSVERRPMKGGLYDLAMGPTDRDTL
jgi:DNA-directed RNA polymerase beta' subunit